MHRSRSDTPRIFTRSLSIIVATLSVSACQCTAPLRASPPGELMLPPKTSYLWSEESRRVTAKQLIDDATEDGKRLEALQQWAR